MLFRSTVIPVSSVLCGLVPSSPVTTLVANPTQFKFTDPVNALLECAYTDPGNGPLVTLPVGTQEYDAALIAANAAGQSAEGTRSNPFWRPGSVPAILTNFRVTKP